MSGVEPASLTIPDGDLIVRCRAGDEAAWRELVSRHARRVFGVVYRFTGRVDEAEDLTQEVFLKVFQSLGRYQFEGGTFAAWLATVARHHAIDHYRRRREERLRADVETLESLPGSGDGPLRAAEKAERARFVHAGLRALPPDLRAPIVLCDLQGLPYEEAARLLGLPLGTVKSRLNRGRLELARRLERRLGGPKLVQQEAS